MNDISDFHQVFMIYYRDNYNWSMCCLTSLIQLFLNIVSFCGFGIIVQLDQADFAFRVFKKKNYKLFCYLPYI